MAVILNCSEGWLLCHKKCSYSNSKSSQKSFRLKDELFHIVTPFVMDSAAQKISEDMLKPTENLEENTISTKRKRKFQDQMHFSSNPQDEDFIVQSFQKLMKLALEQKVFDETPISPFDWLENNRSSRRFAQKLDKETDIFKESETPSCGIKHQVLQFNDTDLEVGAFVESSSSDPLVVNFIGKQFLIPEKASFILGEIGLAVSSLTHFEKKFDLILLDPPWANKSVKRKKKYLTMENDSLQKLPIPELAKPDCLLAVWTTNNTEQNAFVTETLFPGWSVQYCSTWHWIKVTQKGHPVIPFENNHKKPYENLVLGRFQPDSLKASNSEISKKVFVSVPSAIHSHKPSLQDILVPLLPTPNPACLELFARYLAPNWTSCGNEVLKLQHLDYYDIT